MASTMRRRSTVTGRPIEPGVQYGATRSAMRSHSSSLMSPCVVRQVCATPTGSASMTKATRPRTPDGGYPVIDKRGLLEQSLRGETDLVAAELEKLWRFLLGPLGMKKPPGNLQEAVGSYVSARADAAERLGITVPEELGRQVSAALRRHKRIA